ncbi:unnamed protein product [Haemonchus placei]|uniref:EGF-like domain-containing protein n=1 Tax=Haemonchus placei TaxID=6290 RepID=A0A3P7WJ73_HAEPC|nr:unnamed protein product [Haemonchus placei]
MNSLFLLESLKNVAIRDGWGSGIDFISPAENIRIENVSVTNGSSYSIHVVEFPLLPLKSLALQNVSVTDQTRGHAGVLVSSGWVEQIDIDQSLFARNTVPSLIIGVEVRSLGGIHSRNTTFVSNQDTVVNIDVGECGSVGVEGNRFEGNNNDGRNGVLMMNASPRVGLSPFPFIFKAFRSMIFNLNYSGGVCICPADRIGLDCSIMIGCPGNCSGNGVCDILNKCICYDGWTSADCSTPICRFDCHGHGKCVSRDECECNAGWSGQFCDQIGCVDGSCLHGTCVSSKCQCEEGWRGSRCSFPICQNCSINGRCVAPNRCQCFGGYQGEDCSICRGPVCQTCDFDCVHGTCERETRTCSCSRGWSGAACDICRSGNCQVKSSVLYILPSTADREDTNVIVNVFGVDFPKTPSQLYTCIFGASYAEGRRISSSVVRCRVPKDLNLGRHLFNLAPEGSISVIPNFDVRPIHFTVFDSCTPVLCKGVCIGPLCVCPKGTTGINCEIIEIIPSIDWHFIENQKASVAFEGTPYLVVLPTMPGSLHRVNSTIDGLQFDSSRGIIAWDEPLGSNGTYEITKPSARSVGVNTSFWIGVEWEQHLATSKGCDAYVVPLPYLFLPDGSTDIQRMQLLESNRPRPIALRTRVACDCSQGARAACRRKYKSAAACGSAWKRIADDTVSWSELLLCISSLESECPILHRRLKRDIDVMAADGPADVINHVQFIFPRDELVGLWNSTVNEWTSGQMDTPGETEGISYADVKQLIVTADRLQSLTRQNGASDPFSLLHEYIGQILTTNDMSFERNTCAAVYIEPLVIYEDSSVTIDVYIENLQNVPAPKPGFAPRFRLEQRKTSSLTTRGRLRTPTLKKETFLLKMLRGRVGGVVFERITFNLGGGLYLTYQGNGDHARL